MHMFSRKKKSLKFSPELNDMATQNYLPLSKNSFPNKMYYCWHCFCVSWIYHLGLSNFQISLIRYHFSSISINFYFFIFHAFCKKCNKLRTWNKRSDLIGRSIDMFVTMFLIGHLKTALISRISSDWLKEIHQPIRFQDSGVLKWK